MSDGNWGYTLFRRSGGSRRRRVVLAVASIVALVLLVYLAGSFFGLSRAMPGAIWLIASLLMPGIVWGLRPWARK
jgi:hypothetical protein